MSSVGPSRKFTVAIGRRYDFLHLINGRVNVKGIEVEYPPVVKGAPAPIFSRLAEEHPWDIGEQAFSTYLMAYDLGKPQIALPVFPSRFFSHTGVWVNARSDIRAPEDLENRRVGCGSFGINYSVWFRGALTHQYDVAIEKIVWVESVEEHLVAFRPPERFMIEKVPGKIRTTALLNEGKIEAGIMAGVGPDSDSSNLRPLFPDPYREIADYVRQTGVFPINTVITVHRDAVRRNPEMPRLMLDAFLEARALYGRDIAQGKEKGHLGLDLGRLEREAGLKLPDYGFGANRNAIRTMIAYCYEQGIIRRLYEPEDLFLLLDS